MNQPPLLRRSTRHLRGGFSLVEVTLAIGIVAFAFIALFGLVPTGLNVFRAAIDSSIGSQILDQVVQNAQQTDYERLINEPVTDSCYDEQGNLVVDANGVPVKSSEKDPRTIYMARVIAKAPSKVPTLNQEAGNTGALTRNVATLTVKIAKNPGGRNASSFEDGNKANYNTYIAYIARNKSAFETAN